MLFSRKSLPRREFLAGSAALSAALLAGCRSSTAPYFGRDHLSARPGTPSRSVQPGLHPIGLTVGRDGLLYVPASYDPAQPTPLLVLFHGANGSATHWFGTYGERAEAGGFIVLAPDSREGTWDLSYGSFGDDLFYLNDALKDTFDRCLIDPTRVGVAGFSDGASYALSVGLTNGDLFTHAIGYSPGYLRAATARGAPACFVSHGKQDPVLPERNTEREIVPRLRKHGCEVTYVTYEGGHMLPASISNQAMQWLAQEWA